MIALAYIFISCRERWDYGEPFSFLIIQMWRIWWLLFPSARGIFGGSREQQYQKPDFFRLWFRRAHQSPIIHGLLAGSAVGATQKTAHEHFLGKHLRNNSSGYITYRISPPMIIIKYTYYFAGIIYCWLPERFLLFRTWQLTVIWRMSYIQVNSRLIKIEKKPFIRKCRHPLLTDHHEEASRKTKQKVIYTFLISNDWLSFAFTSFFFASKCKASL